MGTIVMPFDQTFANPKLIGEFLTVELKNQRGQSSKATLNLNTVLGNVNGKFKWGGRDFMSTARDVSLNGSILSANLNQGNRVVSDKIDLGLYLKNNNGKLVNTGSSAADAGIPSPTDAPPPAYPKNSRSAAYRSYKSTKLSQESRSSTYFMYTVAADKLRLQGSILHAECLKLDGTYVPQTLDLDEYIGVVNGRLVWGRPKFRAICQNIRLEGYILHADCRDESETTISSSLDLSRYLQCYDGVLGVKMTVNDAELTSFLSEARWMKLRVVTEPDASVHCRVYYRARPAEMNELFAESVGDDIKAELEDKVKAEMNRIVTDSMTAELRAQLLERVEEAFAIAKKTVVDTCNEMIDAAVNKVTISCTESIVGPLGDQLANQCNVAIMNAVEEVTSTAIAHYQERVEILMEREMMVAATRRARTEAALLAMYKELAIGGVWGRDD
ncbi:hypothetical protein D9758_017864 [Tetrapyrgos nigripes]|uniref:Cyanovirin-N domain-containing protein n=1 Tax=Tetrapyrgos nigripes TaxID=182062 RepID=A0A8H5C2P3_9AGAR|nr:hypothetical protein D9758_017864 [Tetrapyrgos nigripes]